MTAKSDALHDLKRRHEQLYNDIVQERVYLQSNTLARSQKAKQIDTLISEMRRRAVEMKDNKDFESRIDDYYWLRNANKAWQIVLSSILGVARIVEPLPEVELMWSAPAKLTREDIDARVRDIAITRYHLRVDEEKDAEILAIRNRQKASTLEAYEEDWFGATVYFAADLLNGRLTKYSLADASDDKVWEFLERVWVKDVINLRAYECWKTEGCPWQEKEEERRREYLQACHEFRERLERADIKTTSEEAVNRLCVYVRERFLDERGEDIDKTKVEPLVRAKAQRSYVVAGFKTESDNWYHADKYVKRFYSNVYNALKWNDQNARNALFRAYEISEGPEYYSSIANCFEAAVLMYFVRGQPKVGKSEHTR